MNAFSPPAELQEQKNAKTPTNNICIERIEESAQGLTTLESRPTSALQQQSGSLSNALWRHGYVLVGSDSHPSGGKQEMIAVGCGSQGTVYCIQAAATEQRECASPTTTTPM